MEKRNWMTKKKSSTCIFSIQGTANDAFAELQLTMLKILSFLRCERNFVNHKFCIRMYLQDDDALRYQCIASTDRFIAYVH
jgi:hypothetical protein